MRKFSFALTGIGLLLIAIFAGADSLGLGGDRGIGATQLLGIQVGAVLLLLGVGLLIVKRDEKTNFKKKFQLFSVLNVPTLYWVLGMFLVTYILFFLFPVFFSKHQIQVFCSFAFLALDSTKSVSGLFCYDVHKRLERLAQQHSTYPGVRNIEFWVANCPGRQPVFGFYR